MVRGNRYSYIISDWWMQFHAIIGRLNRSTSRKHLRRGKNNRRLSRVLKEFGETFDLDGLEKSEDILALNFPE